MSFQEYPKWVHSRREGKPIIVQDAAEELVHTAEETSQSEPPAQKKVITETMGEGVRARAKVGK